jgi:hypothetical protein
MEMDLEKSNEGQKRIIQAEIDRLEVKIAEWRLYNSQSNPGAVWDLREMRRSLIKWQKLLETIDKM